MAADKTRLGAVKILKQLVAQQGSLSGALEKHNQVLSPQQQSLLHAICYGVCRHYHQLNFLCEHFLQKPLRKKDLDIHCLLLIGAYQLLFMRMPDYAVVNECVSCCRQLKKIWAKNLVNAVLRSVQREGSILLEQAQDKPAIYYSHPEWLLKQIQEDWPDTFKEILTANNLQAPMSLRINQSLSSRAGYQTLLKSASIDARPGELCETALILEQACPVDALPGFQKGLISVQDEASQLSVELLQPQNNELILDACAAPGGKSCAILEHAPEAKLFALDNDANRLKKVEENLARIQANATLICADIRQQARDWQLQGQSFDRILLDVPCSATGVIRRHPDIKILRRPEDIDRLLLLQREILLLCWPLLKTGGHLLYTSCSVLKAENSAQVAWFLQQSLDARELALPLQAGLADTHGRQLFPKENSHDGFYYALLQKC